MPGSDDKTVEVGTNEERRLCGLAGDDDEDDLCEDAEELFGHSAQAPLMSAMVKKAGQQTMRKVKRIRTAPSALVPLPW